MVYNCRKNGSSFQEYKSGFEISILALRIAEKWNNKAEFCKAANVLANHIGAYVCPLKLAEGLNKRGFQAGLEAGEIQHAGSGEFFRFLYKS
eukprot:9005215-Ditylum_brightwellii.AAC.1